MTGVRTPAGMSAWRFVAAFGVVSLLADLVYEGARSVTGPYLASLGAGAVLVGVVTGAGEAVALAGRLGTGPLTDRTHGYWPLTLAGYALTVVSVPLLGVWPALAVACTLVITERAGKAVRSPAKDVMLSHAAAAVGRGRGFAVHEALDQIGAVAGPLVVAGVLATTGGSYRYGFGVLAVPGVAVMLMLLRLRARVPDPGRYEPDPPPGTAAPGHPVGGRPRLVRGFWLYLTFVVVTTTGYATFGLLGYHLTADHVLPAAGVPVVYAAAMAAAGLAALAAGLAYDRVGIASLVAVPVLAAAIPPLAFAARPVMAISGALLWGAVVGVQESTMRAAVADLVPTARRGRAYGIFAAGYGGATLAGGALVGGLYAVSPALLTVTVAVLQAVALAMLPAVLAAHRRRGAADPAA